MIGGLVSALVYLALLNVANPDAQIVQAYLARYQASGKVDADYLASLSPDATPALVAWLPARDEPSSAVIEAALADQTAQLSAAAQTDGWPAWHLGRAQALRTMSR